MDKIKFNIDKYKKKPEKKAPKYRFQEICLELAKITGLNKGIIFGMWKRKGWEVETVLREIQSGEIKDAAKYVMWRLKK